MKTYNALIANYMKDFQCTGAACEDTCCSGGWTIPVDKDTYHKYLKLGGEVKDSVSRNTNKNNSFYASMNLVSSGACSMLTEEKLCKVQASHGAELLSNTCNFYPRNHNFINNTLEISATLSCPEIAKLALLQPYGIEFDSDPQYPIFRQPPIMKNIDTSIEKKENKYLWELRYFTISLLQNRLYSLSERLILVGMFFENVTELIDKEQFDALPALINDFEIVLNKGLMRSEITSIPAKMSVQTSLLHVLSAMGSKYKILNNVRYLECYTEFLQGIVPEKNMSDEAIANNYVNSYQLYFKPFLSKYEYILENYVVDYVYKNIFPLQSGTKNFFDEYVTFIINYAIIKFHLIGMSAYHKELTKEHAIKLIQSISRAAISHNKIYIAEIFEQVKASGNNNLLNMIYLIKH